MGTQGPSGGHQQTKRWAFVARAVCTECPKAGRFFGHSLQIGGFAFMHNAS